MSRKPSPSQGCGLGPHSPASRERIDVQLIDALDGTLLWADHFDGSLEKVFDL
jgi:TolB-like protein